MKPFTDTQQLVTYVDSTGTHTKYTLPLCSLHQYIQIDRMCTWILHHLVHLLVSENTHHYTKQLTTAFAHRNTPGSIGNSRCDSKCSEAMVSKAKVEITDDSGGACANISGEFIILNNVFRETLCTILWRSQHNVHSSYIFQGDSHPRSRWTTYRKICTKKGIQLMIVSTKLTSNHHFGCSLLLSSACLIPSQPCPC